MSTEIVSLSGLAEQINIGHEACLASAQNAVFGAIEVGRWLVEAKRRVKHGQWIPWVDENLLFNRFQAAKYMRVFEHRAELEGEMCSGGTHFEGLKGAIAFLSAPNDPEPPKPPEWSGSEEQRREVVEAGRSVVANMRDDKNLIEWAEKEGLFVRVDRHTAWGNPFLLDEDGDRNEVIEAYGVYLTYKPSLQRRYEELRGKVLGCWCYPDACHGDVLIREAYGEPAPDEARRVGCHG